jgi:hypothetical protein
MIRKKITKFIKFNHLKNLKNTLFPLQKQGGLHLHNANEYRSLVDTKKIKNKVS